MTIARALFIATIAFAAGFLLGLALSGPAAAHDWYPVDCCSGHDCFPIDESQIEALPDGSFMVKASHGVLGGKQVRQSQDGRFHLCTRTGAIDGFPVCLFEPPRGF